MQQKWDQRYRGRTVDEADASRVLCENRHLLPQHGRALDLACGLGANACLLARAGLTVQAWDLSPVAVAELEEHARREGLAIDAQVRDVLAAPPAASTFDVIVVVRFLERDLCGALMEALRPGGLLFYQTFTAGGPGPGNPAYRLARGELLRLFADLTPLVYREEHDVGDTSRGLRGEALLVAQRT